jgi:hypothetical protein
MPNVVFSNVKLPLHVPIAIPVAEIAQEADWPLPVDTNASVAIPPQVPWETLLSVCSITPLPNVAVSAVPPTDTVTLYVGGGVGVGWRLTATRFTLALVVAATTTGLELTAF